MGLLKCDECGHLISSMAKSCPNCGIPRSSPNHDEKAKRPTSLRIWSIALGCFAGLLLLFFLFHREEYCYQIAMTSDNLHIVSIAWKFVNDCDKLDKIFDRFI